MMLFHKVYDIKIYEDGKKYMILIRSVRFNLMGFFLLCKIK